MAIVEGWKGRYFEDFGVGDVYEHRIGRTISAADNVWFTCLTMNPNPIHLDSAYAGQTEFGRPLVNSTFTLALVTGLSVADVSQNGINLGWDEVKLVAPVYEGDTLYARTTVLGARPSNSRPAMGIVTVRTEGLNQHGNTVLVFERAILVYRRGHGPTLGPEHGPP